LRGEASPDKLQIFTEAEKSFHRWCEIRNPPQKLSLLADEILVAEKAKSLLREAEHALKTGEYRSLGEKIFAAIHGIQKATWLNIPGVALQR
jgi:hypothetical protein